MQVISPSSAANGFYAVTMNASNSANTGYAASVIGNLAVYSSLGVSIASDLPNYSTSQTVYLNANITANDAPMNGANVTFTIRRPNGTTAASGTVISNSNGVALYSYRFNRKKDPSGTYQVTVNANLNGVTGNATTSFALR
jgi:uncharacterized protein YfaS (alpha-2-macroglobulin family)